MGSKGGSAPSADPRIGQAAMMSAQTGERYLDFMIGQSGIANQWASEDRARYQNVFQPMEDRFIADAQGWDSPERKAAAAAEAQGDVALAARLGAEQRQRSAAAMGVNPASGAFQAAEAKGGLASSLATAGAGNMARRQIEAQADAKRADAINLGKGMAVNPGTSLGLASGAASQGFSGAMQGYNQQGDLLNKQYNQQMQAWQARQDQSSGLWGAVGNIAGMAFMASDENAKTDKKPVGRSLLKAVESMPVEEWTYKPGVGDGGRHVGPYAQDFKRATGKGDGRTINVVDAIGTTMGAVQELSEKVDQLGAGRKPQGRRMPARRDERRAAA